SRLNEKLIHVSGNEFEIEGLPITFKFYKYKGVKKVKVIKSDCDLKEGEIANKYIPVKIDKGILEKYCGTYWCEKDKLERKIILKDDKLIYEREKGEELYPITISRTEFMLFAFVENKIEFKKVKGEWQFTFDIKGKNPSHSLFVKKKIV
ncbi:MAG: hypothetical protein GQ534_00045, partial [Candidatus Delongbacteria bacterium]|nr:hypothetical protein [Candidatus Delongbacteria bacterium]